MKLKEADPRKIRVETRQDSRADPLGAWLMSVLRAAAYKGVIQDQYRNWRDNRNREAWRNRPRQQQTPEETRRTHNMLTDIESDLAKPKK
jgi:hypothetical protein